MRWDSSTFADGPLHIAVQIRKLFLIRKSVLSLNVSQFRNAECGQQKREMSGVGIVNSGALTQVHEANKN